ncbi:MAG: hypothetical protein SGARI_002388 [Bacillariaceae sp.]
MFREARLFNQDISSWNITVGGILSMLKKLMFLIFFTMVDVKINQLPKAPTQPGVIHVQQSPSR